MSVILPLAVKEDVPPDNVIAPLVPVALSEISPVAVGVPLTVSAPCVAVRTVPPVPALKLPVPLTESPLAPVTDTEEAEAEMEPLFERLGALMDMLPALERMPVPDSCTC